MQRQSPDESGQLLAARGGKRRRGVFRPIDFLVAVLLPWLAFTTLLCMFSYMYHSNDVLCWAVCGTLGVLSFFFILVGWMQSRRVLLVIGLMCCIVTLAGAGLGLYVHAEFLDEWYNVDSGADYHNVNPAEPALAYADASILDFQDGTIVNLALSLGYMHQGTIYCAAPIQPGSTQLSYPQFYAVGTECCQGHGSFECGEVENPDARQGVVTRTDQNYYFLTAHMLTQTYNLSALSSSNPPMFVTWVHSYTERQNNLWWRALTIVEASSVAFLVVCLIVASCIARTVSPSS